MRRAFLVCVAIGCALALTACEREKRELQQPPQASKTVDSIRLSELNAGNAPTPAAKANPEEQHAYAIAQGKQWFTWYNCVGCHAHGGGGMGPALMDDKWLYGHEPANIFATIVQGRPNGMPAFGQRIPESQVWQLVAYVRSMSGLVRNDAAPGRNDSIQTAPAEQRRDPAQPKSVSEPQP
jgi:cytochrome c oxidase cbb3-type subunit III